MRGVIGVSSVLLLALGLMPPLRYVIVDEKPTFRANDPLLMAEELRSHKAAILRMGPSPSFDTEGELSKIERLAQRAEETAEYPQKSERYRSNMNELRVGYQSLSGVLEMLEIFTVSRGLALVTGLTLFTGFIFLEKRALQKKRLQNVDVPSVA